jgi:hypothetical protein
VLPIHILCTVQRIAVMCQVPSKPGSVGISKKVYSGFYFSRDT